ncbi:MAG TPA: response regulator transcription factor [Gemmatimonadales bacterium]|jgi:DNA-binding NarL/FixJ family response regulator
MPSTPPLHAAPTTIKLLLADERLVVREGLKRILTQPGLRVVGEAATRSEVLEQARRSDPDVLLLDPLLGGSNILSLIRELKRRHLRCGVLVLNVEGEDPDALRILGTGAGGYVSKDYSRRELLEAIRQVARGASYVSPSLAAVLIARLSGGKRPRHEALSDREYQVLRLFGSGISFKQIAADLGVSPKTVSTYRSRILDKLKLKGSADIIRYAIEHRLGLAAGALPRRRKSPTDPSQRL